MFPEHRNDLFFNARILQRNLWWGVQEILLANERIFKKSIQKSNTKFALPVFREKQKFMNI